MDADNDEEVGTAAAPKEQLKAAAASAGPTATPATAQPKAQGKAAAAATAKASTSGLHRQATKKTGKLAAG